MSITSKHLSATFVEENAEVSEELAHTLIVEATKEISELKAEMKGDERLQAAKQIVNDLRESYTSSIKYSQSKITFLLEKLAFIEDEGPDANPHSSLKQPTI